MTGGNEEGDTLQAKFLSFTQEMLGSPRDVTGETGLWTLHRDTQVRGPGIG